MNIRMTDMSASIVTQHLIMGFRAAREDVRRRSLLPTIRTTSKHDIPTQLTNSMIRAKE